MAMNIEEIISFLKSNNITYSTHVDLKKKTWIHRGGIADLFIQPEDTERLSVLIEYLYSSKLDFLVIGHTSNLYILNTTNLPIVVSTLKCNKFSLREDLIECDAGVSVIKLAKEMVSKGVSGFEYLTDLPGTVGAALVNNSSCCTNDISSLLLEADVITSDGNHKKMRPEDFNFKFRSSIFKKNSHFGTIVKIWLKRVDANDATELKNRAIENEIKRRECVEGHAMNLGCAMNQPFSLGPMFFRYKLISWSIAKTIKLFHINCDTNVAINNALCCFSGCGKAAPYISPKGSLIFIWKDLAADEAFPYYVKFMRKVYRTKSLEIQII